MAAFFTSAGRAPLSNMFASPTPNTCKKSTLKLAPLTCYQVSQEAMLPYQTIILVTHFAMTAAVLMTTLASHMHRTGNLPGALLHARILISCISRATLLPLISFCPMLNCHMNSEPISAPIAHTCNQVVGLMAAGLFLSLVSSQLPLLVCGGLAPPSPPRRLSYLSARSSTCPHAFLVASGWLGF